VVRHVLRAPAVAGVTVTVTAITITITAPLALAPAPRTVGMGKPASPRALVAAGAVAPRSLACQAPA